MAPRSAAASSLRASRIGARTSTRGRTRRRAISTDPRPPASSTSIRPRSTAACSHPLGPEKSTSRRPARKCLMERVASSSMRCQASSVTGASSFSKWFIGALLLLRACGCETEGAIMLANRGGGQGDRRHPLRGRPARHQPAVGRARPPARSRPSPDRWWGKVGAGGCQCRRPSAAPSGRRRSGVHAPSHGRCIEERKQPCPPRPPR